MITPDNIHKAAAIYRELTAKSTRISFSTAGVSAYTHAANAYYLQSALCGSWWHADFQWCLGLMSSYPDLVWC
jgi:hypothetical protein